jgi:Glycosyltransferase family 87
LATKSGAFASLLAAAALLAPSPAAAAPRPATFDAGQAIGIAASDPAIGPIEDHHPGSHFTAVFIPRSRTWQIKLVAAKGHPVLASFVIADGIGTVLRRDVTGSAGPPHLTDRRAYAIAARPARVRRWLAQYRNVTHTVSLGDNREWTVKWSAGGDDVAEVHVVDATGRTDAVWTGPQVGWMMTRGLPDAYGRKVVDPWVLWPMCAIFAAGLLDWRRLRSWRTLDVLALLSFTASLVFFDRGDVFISTPLIYPPLIYLAARMVWIAGSRAPRPVRVGDRHLLILIGLIFALMGFRLGLNNQDSNVIDVGYAGVVGASRLLDGQVPYGNFPQPAGTPCGGSYGNGDPVGYVQPDHRCESPIANGDTYGPSVYAAYVPAVAIFGWSGRWDSLPAAHVAAGAFDVLAVAGLFVAGWRLRSPRIGVLLAFAWAASPFTAYSLNMNANDGLVGAAVAWTLAVLSIPAARGVMLAVAGFTKLGPFAMLPVLARMRGRVAMAIGFVAGTAALLSMLLLGSHGLTLLWDRTIAYQAGRITPMSIWTLPNYHPGWPHLGGLQKMAQIAIVIGIALLAVFPRRGRRDAASIAALCGAAVIGAQLVASYWFYPYICWWLPAVVAGMLLPRGDRPTQPAA